jgi:hypothetical protein
MLTQAVMLVVFMLDETISQGNLYKRLTAGEMPNAICAMAK